MRLTFTFSAAAARLALRRGGALLALAALPELACAQAPTFAPVALVDVRTYPFAVSSTEAQALITRRSSPLATAPALGATEVSVFLNPAHDAFTVLVPAVP
jgi:hypothetical protein